MSKIVFYVFKKVKGSEHFKVLDIFLRAKVEINWKKEEKKGKRRNGFPAKRGKHYQVF